MVKDADCPFNGSRERTAKIITDDVIDMIKAKKANRLNAIWLEASGCSGNIISFLNGENPDHIFVLKNLINLKFNNTIMSLQGETAFKQFLNTLDTEFILLVDGAVSTKENGMYNIIAKYNDRSITALEAVKSAGSRAKYVLAVGTCASYGGISAGEPNPSGSRSVSEVLEKDVIKLPLCPCHPDYVTGTIAHLAGYGMPALDEEGRPLLFYGVTIHDRCTRRGFFDKKIFAKKFGDEGCMFKIGCRGPVTRTDCPSRKWNGYVNWPVGDNTTCIGCAHMKFPDGMMPFVRY